MKGARLGFGLLVLALGLLAGCAPTVTRLPENKAATRPLTLAEAVEEYLRPIREGDVETVFWNKAGCYKFVDLPPGVDNLYVQYWQDPEKGPILRERLKEILKRASEFTRYEIRRMGKLVSEEVLSYTPDRGDRYEIALYYPNRKSNRPTVLFVVGVRKGMVCTDNSAGRGSWELRGYDGEVYHYFTLSVEDLMKKLEKEWGKGGS